MDEGEDQTFGKREEMSVGEAVQGEFRSDPFDLPFEEFCERAVVLREEFELEPEDIPAWECPVHKWALRHGAPCRKTVQRTEICPVCGSYMCPDCKNHAVEVISRITGYLQAVSGWNAGKRQELKERHRYGGGALR